MKWYYKGLTGSFLGFYPTNQQPFATFNVPTSTAHDSNGIQCG